jgi:hypothetical protein
MNWIKNIFISVKGFFTKLFGNNASAFMELIEKVSPIVNKAYPVVKKIAQLTPTKTDDVILAAYEELGFKGMFVAGSDKGLALRDLAKKLLLASSPDPISDYIANTAIELAYAKYKEELNKTQD